MSLISKSYATREEWRESRRHVLGSTSFAGLALKRDGTPAQLSKYATRYSIWRSKVESLENQPERSEDYMYWGDKLEGEILDRFAFDHPEWDVEPTRMTTFEHPAHPLVCVTPDGLVYPPGMGDNYVNAVPIAGVDAKNLTAYRKGDLGEPGTDQVPDDWKCQGVIFCDVFQVPRWHFAVLLGGNAYSEYVVDESPAFAAKLIADGEAFWDEFVVPNVMPPVTAMDDKLLGRGHAAEGVVMPATEKATELIIDYLAANEQLKPLEKQRDGAKAALKGMMVKAKADAIDGIVTWHATKTGSRQFLAKFKGESHA